MQVKEIMRSPVITATVDAPTSRVAALLGEHSISGVPVVDKAGAVVGLVSEYDLMAKTGRTAREVMTSGVISVTPETDVDDVRVLLVDRRIRRVPVMSGRDLVGIVSRGDVVALIAVEQVCQVCGEPVRGQVPEKCPRCGASGGQFIQQEQPPGE
jgi:CBS domain-containing protein